MQISPDFSEQAKSLTTKLRARKYPDNILRKAFKRACKNNRETLLDNPIKLTSTDGHNAASDLVSKSINRHWRILTSGNIDFEKPMFSHRKGKSLRNTLVHTRPAPIRNFGTENSSVTRATGHYPCGSCSTCKFTTCTKSVTCQDGSTWELRGLTNCNTTGVIYCITCPCGLQYVGMTTRKIKLWIREHWSTI